MIDTCDCKICHLVFPRYKMDIDPIIALYYNFVRGSSAINPQVIRADREILILHYCCIVMQQYCYAI